MGKIPTDLEILEEIYNRYYDDFRKFARKEPDRVARIRVPINIEEVANACGVGEDMIFGRLFYHFNKKYSYKNNQGEVTAFFITEKFEGLSVNFSLVASILADKYAEQNNKRTMDTSIAMSATAVGVSVLALLVAFFV